MACEIQFDISYFHALWCVNLVWWFYISWNVDTKFYFKDCTDEMKYTAVQSGKLGLCIWLKHWI